MIVFLLLIMTCNKDSGKSEDIIAGDLDDLSTEDAEYLDKIEHIRYSIYDIMLQNGQSVYDYLNENDPGFLKKMGYSLKPAFKSKTEVPLDYKMVLIARLMAAGSDFTDRNKFKFSAVSGDANSPAQNGLAYSFGQKDYMIREKPPWDGNKCPQKIYGLDCSGLVYQMAGYSELFFPPNPKNYCNAKYLSETSNWEKVFQNSAEFKNLRIEDFGPQNVSDIETGDIIYWNHLVDGKQKTEHIAIALSSKSGCGAYMSYGNSRSCEANLSNLRGPILLKLDTRLMKNWFGAKTCNNNCTWGVLRITADMHYFPYNGCQTTFWSRASFKNSQRGDYKFVLNSTTDMRGTLDFTSYDFNGTICNVCGKNARQTLKIAIDLEEHTINSFEWSFIDSTLQEDGKHYQVIKTTVSSSGQEPIQGNYPNYYFSVKGPDVNKYIGKVTAVGTWWDIIKKEKVTDYLTSLNYDNDTKLEIKFHSIGSLDY
jgi:hypothetical protein